MKATVKNALLAIWVSLGVSFALTANASAAEASLDLSALGRVPILHEGRIKPLDTFARVHLLAYSGKSSLPEKTAMAWLMEVLLDSDTAFTRRVFNVADPSVVEALGIERTETHRYTFIELARGFQANGELIQQLGPRREEERTATQNHIIELYEKFISYLEISRSFGPFMPELRVKSPKLAQVLGVAPGARFTFRDLRKMTTFEANLKARLAVKPEGMVAEGFTPEDQTELAELAFRVERLQRDRVTEVFRIMAPQWESSQEVWLSPTALIGTGLGSPATSRFLDHWKALFEAYQDGDSGKWALASQQIFEESQQQSKLLAKPWKMSLEYFYSRADLFTKSIAFYVLAFLLLALSWIVWPARLMKWSMAALSIGFVMHLVGMVMRMVIMNRPPVATLYESIIFVGLIAVGFGIFLERTRRSGVGVLIGSLAGAVLQFMGTRYQTSGDTMGMLVAVLDTNFWLATHVVTITIGYGCCLVGGLLGHVYLLLRIFKPKDTAKADELSRNMVGVALVALFFCLFGTILGGIWADQSWGRFWGWDPKENGALWIVLWILFIAHARICGMLGKIGFAAGMVLTNIIVALAWFGVNLLNVGLHSYGFTSNIAWNLGLFCGGEFLFALITYALAKQRETFMLAQANPSAVAPA